jgi:hypothetical protein
LSLWLAACSAVSPEEIERAEHEPYDDEPEVAVSTHALGVVDKLGEVCGSFCDSAIALHHPVAAVVSKPNNDTIMTVEVEEEVRLAYDNNRDIRSVIAAPDGYFYYNFIDSGLNGGIAELGFFGSPIIGETFGEVRGMVADDTKVYFVDGRGLNSRPRSGGCCTENLLDPEDATSLLGRDGNKLFFLRSIGGGQYQLRRITTGGGSNTLLRTLEIIWAFSQDASNLYWAEDGGTEYLVRKMNKSTLAVSTLRSTTRIPYSTAAKDGVVYWSELPSGGGTMSIMRRSGNLTSTQRNGMAFAGSLLIDGNFLYWLDMASAGDPVNLMRASL